MPTTGLIHADGTPMKRSADRQLTSYQAADPMSQELASWRPHLNSADSDLLYERDEITARIRDMARNNGWASSGLTREIDNVVGAGFRLSSKPDWRALGLSAEWAAEFASQLEAIWRNVTHDPAHYFDASRHTDVGGLFGLGYRHYLVDGDALGVLLWLPDRGANYATALQIVDPDRLSNPNGASDQDHLRGGVERDEQGAAIAYHIRKRHPHDVPALNFDAFAWERIPRETAWGRPIVLHFYDKERSGQTRGIGRLTPVLERLKMLDRYDKVELQASVLNAILAAFIESPFDHEMLEGAFGGEELGKYQAARSVYHGERRLTLGGVRIPALFPGEKLGFHAAARPNTAFADFEAACLRYIAAGTGQSYEQLSGDWSRTNYSSARGALLEIWKTLGKRRTGFANGFATPALMAVTEEAIERRDLVLPAGAPDFYSARAAYCRCRWIGPGRGWVDPVKEKQGAILGVAGSLSTLEDECAEQGKDWEEVLAQQAIEIERMKGTGVLHPAQIDMAKIVGAHQQDEARDRRPAASGGEE